MYYLKTEQSFDAAHFLEDYQGKCRNIHGHRWRVTVQIKKKTLNENPQTRSMLLDFDQLKSVLKEICDHMDHCLIYEAGSLKPATIAAMKEENFKMIEVDFRPTAENFACYFYHQMQEKGYAVHRIEVYETPKNCAVYEA